MKQQLAKVEQIVESYDCEPSNLIAIMQEIQNEFNYLSEGALEKIAEMLEIPISRVYSVATFYENFSLEAKGEHIIKVCTGTACHVRKSEPIYNALREELKLTGKKKASLKVKGLAKGTYYVKVRAINNAGGVKYYTSWSKVKKVKAAATSASPKTQKLTFKLLGIPKGATLEYVSDPNVKATVLDSDSNVQYNGEKYTLSGLVKHLKNGGTWQGGKFFKYKGEVLTDIRKRLGV